MIELVVDSKERVVWMQLEDEEFDFGFTADQAREIAGGLAKAADELEASLNLANRCRREP